MGWDDVAGSRRQPLGVGDAARRHAPDGGVSCCYIHNESRRLLIFSLQREQGTYLLRRAFPLLLVLLPTLCLFAAAALLLLLRLLVPLLVAACRACCCCCGWKRPRGSRQVW